MARKSITELEAQADLTLEDNSSGAITPSDVRAMFKEFLNAIRPAYGVLQMLTSAVQNYGLTPVKVVWSNASSSDIGQITASAATGSLQRADRGTTTINFTMDFECQTGRYITFTLFKDGVATPWRVTGNGGGNGNPIGVAMTAVDYADPAATYDIRATAELANTATTVSNGSLIAQIEPVNAYT